MNCDKCNNSCDTCGGCSPSRYRPYFNLMCDPYDEGYWLWEMGCDSGRVKLPKLPETCTSLSTDYTNATLNYAGECEHQALTGEQIGNIIRLQDLRDVDAKDPDSCSLLVFNPGCASECSPDDQRWKKYVIPDAGDCVVEPDSDGYYKVLVKTDCGCIKECRIPVVPNGMVSINYVRDSVPDDPDFPWYYGCYNDTINLHLQANAPQYFGKYALKVTVNYGIQVILSDQCKNVNFRSLVVPVVDGDTSINVEKESSILQGFSGFSTSTPEIPWGSNSMRGSFSFIVPKGKEAYLHHEFRLRTKSSFPNYYTSATYDGKVVPDNIASQVNQLPWNASRLNALQVIVEPTNGVMNYNPTADPERSQLDAPVDEYPSL